MKKYLNTKKKHGTEEKNELKRNTPTFCRN